MTVNELDQVAVEERRERLRTIQKTTVEII